MVWSLQNLEKQHPKPLENLEDAALQSSRNLGLAKARWRVTRAAHWIIPPHPGAGIAIMGDTWVSGWYTAATELMILKNAYSAQQQLVGF